MAYNPDLNQYLAVWEDDTGGSQHDIYGQVISPDGSLAGSPFAIATAGGNQFDPVVAYHSGSQSYLVAWWDRRSGTDWDIYGQLITGTSSLSGSNFAISTAGNDQEYPALAVRPGSTPGEFLVLWQDRRSSSNRDIYGQRVSAAGALLDEPDTGADETDPTVNLAFDPGSAYTERPAVTYQSQAAVYLAAWNNRNDGGIYTRRYTPSAPPTPAPSFTAEPGSGVVPLTVTFTDTSSGTISSRTWDFGDGITTTVIGGAPLSHTYLATGAFTATLTVTNPAGSAFTSTLITVTEQITPALSADFEALDLGSDPTFWLDQLWDTTGRDDFETLWADDSRALATTYTGNVVYSHYAIPGRASWQNYEYQGRLKMSDPGGGIGLALLSRYPANEQSAYVLRRYVGSAATEQFHLAAFGTGLQGDTNLGVTPQANTWYRFRVQAVTHADRVTLRAKVWAEGETEPLTWQAEAYDTSATRLAAGAAGVRTQGAGAKYFDDLGVTPLAVQADFSAPVRSGFAPFSPTFSATPLGQVLTYTWHFGDGSLPVVTTSVVLTHTYTEVGSYEVSLTVEGPTGTDTLTRANYLIAADLATGLRGYWPLEEAGGQRLDSSGYGNHLTETNTVASAAGQAGQAADLERSSSEYLSIDHTLQTGLAITGSLTLAGWLTLESLNQSMIVTSKYEFGVNNRAYRLDIRDDNRPAFIVSPDGLTSDDFNLVATTPLTAATWYHLAAVFDAQSQTMALYLDGTPVATRSVTYDQIYASTAPFMLGANLSSGSPTQFFDGLLDEWRVYARALSQSEIAGLMAATAPTVAFSATPLTGTAPLTVTFSNETTGPATYVWGFGDGLTSTLVNPSHVYTGAGLYTVTLTATGPGGSASLTRTHYITVTSAISAAFVAAPLTGTAPLTVTFSSSSTGASGYLWDFGDGTTSTEISPTHVYTGAGIYTVTLSAGDGIVTDTLTRTNYITVTQAVVANFSAFPISGPPPLTIQFFDNSTGASSYLWDFGDGLTATLSSPTHTYTVAGVYTVSLTVSDGVLTDTLTRTNYITVTEAVVADFSAEPLIGTVPLTVTFANSSTGASDYLWDFGDSLTSTVVSPTHTYTQTGVYTVSLTASGPGGSDTLTRSHYITVTEPVTANFSAEPLTGMAPLTVTFINSSANATGYLWDFGDNVTDTVINPAHTYTQAGVYTVTLTASDGVMTDTLTRTNYITVYEAIGVDFAAEPLTGTAPLTVTFINSSTHATDYVWDFGDSLTSTVVSPTHTYTQAGVYTISLTAIGPGGSNTLTRTHYITVTAPLAANFTADPLTGTIPLTVTFTNSSTGATGYLWSYGDGITSTTSTLTHTHSYTQAGVYTVTLSASDGVMTDTLTQTHYITAFEAVIADFSAEPLTGTTPLTVTFINSSTNATDYLWDFGDSITSTVISPTHSYTQAGVYTVTLAASDGVFTDTLTRTNYITVAEPLVAGFSAEPLTGTVPLTVTFANSSTGASTYLWDFGDSITSTIISPTHSYTQAGIYTVTLAASDGVFTDTLTQTNYITAYEAVRADFSASPLTGTVPLTVTFINSSTGASTYLWDFGDSITSTVISPTHVYTQPGIYTVTLSVSNGSVTDTLTRSAYIEGLGADFTAAPQYGPAPLVVTFTGSLSDRVESWAWDFGDGFSQTLTTQISTTHIYTQPGVYTPTLTIVREGYTYTETKTAYITTRGAEFNASPQAGSAPLVVTFTDIVSTPATYRAWDFGDGSPPLITTGSETATSLTTTHTYTQTGVYSVTLTVERDGYTYTQTVPDLVLVSQAACAITGTQMTWWDSRFLYRQPITLTVGQPLDYTAGVTRVLALTLDTQSLISDSLILPGGEDLRIVYRETTGWRDLPRQVEGLNTPTTMIYFPLQATITNTDTDYYLYYGHAAPGAPPALYSTIESGAILTTTGSGTFTPTVAFTASTYAGLAPLNVTFANLTTPTAGISSYAWTFGDGGSSSATSPSHTYTGPGLYTVTLTAETTEGLSVSNTWPAAIQVPGVDATTEATANLGQPETAVTVATICAGVTVPQSFTSADSRLTITFPPGAVQETIIVTHTPQALPYYNDGVMALYELTATTLNGIPVTTFSQEVAFELHYDNSISPEWLERSIAGFSWNETNQVWEYLPTNLDITANIAHFRTDHFSLFAATVTGSGSAGLTSAADTLPSAVNAAQSDLFSGAATWAYPLHVPPGRNGLQPDLTLTYNSHLAETNQTSFQKSGWLGLGFSLESGFVEIEPLAEYGTVSVDANGQLNPNGAFLLFLPPDIEAYLTLNGSRTRLVRDGDWFPDPNQTDLVANFRLQQDNFLRVELWRNGEDRDETLETNLLLASTSAAPLGNLYWVVTTKAGTRYRFGYTANSTEVDLRSVFQECNGYSPACAFQDISQSLKWMSYPKRAYLDQMTDIYDNTIIFEYTPLLQIAPLYDGASTEEVDRKSFNVFTRLDQINYTDATRQVAFEYGPGRTDLPTNILPGTTYRLYPEQMLTVTMSVDGDEFLRYEFGYDQITFDYLVSDEVVPFLDSITVKGKDHTGTYQALAAHTTFEYYNRTLSGYSVDPLKGYLHQIRNGYGGVTTFDYNLLDKRVNQIRTEDENGGPHTKPIIRTFLKTGIPGQRHVWVRSGFEDGGGSSDPNDTTTHYVFHTQYDLNPFDTKVPPLTGQLERVEIVQTADVLMIPAGVFLEGLPLQATCYQYPDNLPTSTDENVFVAPEKVTTVFDGTCDSADGIAVEYEYDPYGNVETISEWGDPNDAGDDRFTELGYVEDLTNWVLNRPEFQIIRDANNNIVAQTEYEYTPQGSGQAALAEVEVTQIDTVNGADLVSRVHYNDDGNIAWAEDGPGHRTEITAYDSSRTFPERVRYPAVQAGVFETETIYNPRWGTPVQTTGLNPGETTSYFYDPFGRLTQVTDPVATTLQLYDDQANGLEVQTIYGYGTADSYQTWTRYNGLGQLTQTETEAEGNNANIDYHYDQLGRLIKTSVPYPANTTASMWTETNYDTLGRTKMLSNPDSTSRSFIYDGWQQVTLTDEMERQTVYQQDAFGRPTQVTQYQDEDPLTTFYRYNPLGHLIEVEDAEGNIAEMGYDSLSRLIQESNGDFGQRTYTYECNSLSRGESLKFGRL